MKKKRLQHYYLPFWMTFFTTIFAASTIMGAYYLVSQQPSETTDAEPEPVLTYQPTPQESQNILIVGCESRHESAKFFILIRFDAMMNRCFVMAVPEEVKSTVNVKEMTLLEHYDYGDSEYARQAIENMFLISVHHVIRMDVTAIQKMVDFFGGLNFDVPYQIKGNPYNISPGNQLLDGVRFAQIMLKGDPELNQSLVQQFIKNNFVKQQWERRDRFQQILFDDCDTDYTSLQLTNLSQMFQEFFYSGLDNKVEKVMTEGEYYNDGKEFEFTQESIEQVRGVFL